jgi:Protein of unknown function (DUF3352)
MNILRRISLLLIAFLIFSSFAAAQKRRGGTARPTTPAPAPQPGPAFENVLASDSYRVYVEVRGVGQLLKSPSFNDVIDPLIKVASPPKEFKTLLAWLNSQSDSLMTSRMMVASWAARPKLPNVLLAIEFSSPEDAQKFEPRLKNFLPKILPTPAPSSSPESSARPMGPGEKKEDEKSSEPQVKEAGPRFVIKQAGSLVYVSDSTFSLKNLRPEGSKLLTEDPDFRRVHDRFSTESILVFVDTGGMNREDEERRRKLEEENLKLSQAEPTPSPDEAEQLETSAAEDQQPETTASPEPVDPDVVPQVETQTHTQVDLTSAKAAPPPDVGNQLIGRMANLLFSGTGTLPDALGVALAFEPDSYSVRLLLVNEPNVKGNPIPFMPQLISGPPLTSEAAALFPADTEFFGMLSLDYQQIYDSMARALAEQASRASVNPVAADISGESPFVVYEKRTGIKVKDDLIPLLGNEVAFMLPLQTLDVAPTKPVAESTASDSDDSTAKTTVTQGPSPVIAIAVRDREGVRALLPKILESFFTGASLLARTEKKGDVEIVSYENALAYAFIGNFLLISPAPKQIRHVVDSYLNHDTLGSIPQYRSATRWQPRQVMGQFYMSPKLMESYRDYARSLDTSLTDQIADLLSRLSPTEEPLTYALSNEGLGPMHELRLPRNLVLLMLASMFGTAKQSSSAAANEAVALGMLRTISSAETSFRATSKGGSYGSLDELVTAGLISKEMLEKSGYRIEVNSLGTRFEATAIPMEYGKTGKLSFFIDESNILRAGDHGGGPATVADKPVGQ